MPNGERRIGAGLGLRARYRPAAQQLSHNPKRRGASFPHRVALTARRGRSEHARHTRGRLILGPDLPKLTDVAGHVEVLQASGLDWEIACGPRLNDQPHTGRYRVGWVGVNASTSIGRADLAKFILKQVNSDEFVGQMPFVSY